jgi:nucleolar protein 15
MLQTGQSKHYGFIEFDSSSVAQIVADTMDNYLLMGHIMRCKVIPKDQVHPELWVGANRRWRPVPKVRVAKAEHNKVGGPSSLCNIARAHYISLQLRTQDEQMRVAHRLLKRQEERQRKLEKAGISYDLGAAGYVVSIPYFSRTRSSLLFSETCEGSRSLAYTVDVDYLSSYATGLLLADSFSNV